MRRFLQKSFCFFVFIQVLLSKIGYAQDIQFSQYYAVATYHNPAFIGSLHLPRAIVHERLQWPGLSAKYSTSLVSFDTYLSKINSGVGVTVIKDFQGPGIINTTEINLGYSYELNISDNFSFRSGLQMGFVTRKLNYSTLTFPDQFNDNDGYIGGPINTGVNRIYYPDIAAGGIFYSKKAWIGFAGHHLNQPNQSFYNDVSKLPGKFSFTGGYKIIVKNEKYMAYIEAEKEFSVTPTFLYKFQGKSDQLDLGLYCTWDALIGGIWYKGIPVLKQYNSKLQNNESIVPMIGWRYKNFIFSYSYDMTISRLTRARTYGAHEFNVTYVNYTTKRKYPKPRKRLPCPKFL